MSWRSTQLKPADLSLWQIAKLWLSSLVRVDGVQLPPEGRSSVEPQKEGIGALSFGSVIPEIDFSILAKLKKLSICNPDFSQRVGNLVSLGNTGHTIQIDAPTERAAETALARVNESAARLYPNGAGIDGLINAYLAQIAIFGALSSEDVVNVAAQRVEKVVLVPVEQIRFRYVDGEYVPHQQPRTLLGAGRGPLGLIPLNPVTYRYYALQTVENSPYARPPATAAVDILCGPQADALDNIKWIVKKLGILGLVAVLLRRPSARAGETDTEFRRRADEYLTKARDYLDGNFNKGLFVGYKGEHEIDHANVASDGRGSAEIFQVIEEQAFSGMGSMAWEHGRNYTTTETFADVVYNILISHMQNIQRLTKRRQEQTYRLDLLLAGIPFDGITLSFNRAEARNEYQKAQADQLRQSMALERASRGIISPDEAAQELGYEAAFDPELVSGSTEMAGALSRLHRAKRDRVTAICRFDRAAQRYRLVSSRIELAGAPDERHFNRELRIADFEKKRIAA